MLSNLIQAKGPFTENTPIIKKWPDDNMKLAKIAVQINPAFNPIICRNPSDYSEGFLQENSQKQIQIGPSSFYIGWSGILELSDIEIFKEDLDLVYFLQNEPSTTIVDLIFEQIIVKEDDYGN